MNLDPVMQEVIFADNATTSSVLELSGNYSLAALIYPNIVTSTAMKFSVSYDGVTYYTLENSTDASDYSIAVTAGASAYNATTVSRDLFKPWKYVKFIVADSQTDGPKTMQCLMLPNNV